MAEQTSNVASKIALIMAGLPVVEKGLVNYKTKSGATVRYQAYSIDSIVGHLRLLMGEHKLALVPQMGAITTLGSTPILNYVFTLIDADSGDSMACPWMQPLNSNGNISQDFGSTLSYAVKNFLMRTFMISPEGDAPDLDFTPPTDTTTTDSKPAQNKPASKNTAQNNASNQTKNEMSDRKKIALAKGSKLIHKIEKVKGLNVRQQAQWRAYTKIDDTDYTFLLWANRLRLIEQELQLDENALDIKDVVEFPPHKQIAVFTQWDNKYGAVMGSELTDFDDSFNNPAMRTRFLDSFKDLRETELCKALNLKSLSEYKGSLRNAIDTVNDYLDGKQQADLQNMDDTPGNVSAYSDIVAKTKQKQMAGMPAYEDLG